MKICQSVYFRLSKVSPLDHGLRQFLIFTRTFVVQTRHGFSSLPPLAINPGDWRQTKESDFTAWAVGRDLAELRLFD